jgi:hypothetical protein
MAAISGREWLCRGGYRRTPLPGFLVLLVNVAAAMVAAMASGSQGEGSITNPAGGTAMGCAGGRSAGRAEGAQMPGDARPPAGTGGCRVGRVGWSDRHGPPHIARPTRANYPSVMFPGSPAARPKTWLRCSASETIAPETGCVPECGDRAPYAASLQCRVGHRGSRRGRAPDDPAPRPLVRLHRGGTATGSCCQTTPAWSMAGQFTTEAQ